MVKKYQMPDWMFENRRFLRDERHLDLKGNPTRYAQAKKFDTITLARRYANRMESNYRPTKIIELIPTTKKSKEYLVFVKVKLVSTTRGKQK